MLESFKADIRRYAKIEPRKSLLLLLLTKEGLWATAEHRFNHWVYYQVKTPVVRQGLQLLGAIAHRTISLITRIELPKQATIGKGLYIPHASSVIVHPGVSMGEHCTISQEVTIGEGGRGENKGWPQIGNRVYIAPGAKIFGAITIGDDVAIGANAVVNKNVEHTAVAAGVPAKVISHQGSADFL